MSWRIRKGVFFLHQVIGLLLGVFFLIQGITGSLLVFAPQWDRELHPIVLKIPHHESTNILSLEEILRIAQAKKPGIAFKRLKFPKTNQEPYELCFQSAQEPCFYLNPYAQNPEHSILGERNREQTAPRWLLQLHEKFLMGDLGETCIGILGILLVLMSFSGIWLWWPFKRFRFKQQLPIGAPWNKTSFRIHRWFGFGVSLLLAITSLTGVGMVFAKPFEKFLQWITPRAAQQEPIPSQKINRQNTSPPTITELLSIADQALPFGKTTMIFWPKKKGEPLQIRKRMPEELHPNGKTRIYLDPTTGEIKKTEDARMQPLGSRIMNLFYPIHTGEIGGLPTKVIQVFVGLSPMCLFISGLLMWRNRRVYRKSHKDTSSTK